MSEKGYYLSIYEYSSLPVESYIIILGSIVAQNILFSLHLTSLARYCVYSGVTPVECEIKINY